MKHYIVTYEDRLWLSYAPNPKEAINQIIAMGVDGDFKKFVARSVGSLVNQFGKVMQFQVADAE